jgi:metal transporter CNNM
MLKYTLPLSLISTAKASEEWISPLPADEYIIFSLVSLLVVCFAGAMSGLTVGLLSIDPLELEIKVAKGTEEERKMAKRIQEVVANHHLLLVTLLLGNACAMESLPILLDKMFAEVLSVLISVTFVLIFGEVLPQAFCTGPNQLKIAYRMVPLVKAVKFVLFPISWPIAKALDKLLGHEEGKRFQVDELKALIELHQTTGVEESYDTVLQGGQVKIIHGAIDIATKKVIDHMIHEEMIYSISEDALLDRNTIENIINSGFSRVPVHAKDNKKKILGILYSKRLATVKKNTQLRQSGISYKAPVYIRPENTLYELMEIFKQRSCNMVFVVASLQGETIREQLRRTVIHEEHPEISGLITLQDVVDELLSEDFSDRPDLETVRLSLRGRSSIPYRLSEPNMGSQPMTETVVQEVPKYYHKVAAGRPLSVRYPKEMFSSNEYTLMQE